MDQNKTLVGPIELLKNSWALFSKHVGLFLLIMLINMAALFGVVLGFVILGGILAAIWYFAFKSAMILFIILGALLFMAFFLVIGYASLWGQLAMLIAIHKADTGITVGNAYREARKSGIISLYWVGFLASFVITGGFLIFIVPGIIFTVWFAFATYIFVVEGTKGMNALLKSREYARGYWLALLGRMLFIFAVSLVFSLIQPIMLLVGKDNTALKVILDTLNGIMQLASFILSPIFIIYPFLLFKNLKAVKGDIVVDYSRKNKLKYLACGLISSVFFLLLFFVSFFLILSQGPIILNEYMQNSKKAPNSQNLPRIDAFNPNKQFAQANDAKRRSDVAAIANAISIYVSEGGSLPQSITATPTSISKDGIDLCALLVPEYIAAFPIDPAMPYDGAITNCNQSYTSGYIVSIKDGVALTVAAPNGELDQNITISTLITPKTRPAVQQFTPQASLAPVQ